MRLFVEATYIINRHVDVRVARETHLTRVNSLFCHLASFVSPLLVPKLPLLTCNASALYSVLFIVV